MKIVDLYSDDASEQWFTWRAHRGSVHGNLLERGFEIVDRELLSTRYADLAVPLETRRLSWGSPVPCPLPGRSTAFVAAYPYDLSSVNFLGESLDTLIDRWMDLMPGRERYLVSLHESSYLFAIADRVTIDDVHCVTGRWDVDSFVGVFDDSQKLMFTFDIEFGVIYLSFDKGSLPEGFHGFVSECNPLFREVFVRDAKFRTGADPDRAEEYYRTVLQPAM